MYPWTESPRSIHAAETLPDGELYKLRKPGSFVNYEALFPEESGAKPPHSVGLSCTDADAQMSALSWERTWKAHPFSSRSPVQVQAFGLAGGCPGVSPLVWSEAQPCYCTVIPDPSACSLSCLMWSTALLLHSNSWSFCFFPISSQQVVIRPSAQCIRLQVAKPYREQL